MLYVKCKKCNWVSFAITKQKALEEIAQFNQFYYTLTKKEQNNYYGGTPSSEKTYTCLRCNNRDFNVALPEEIPFGSTINPVIYEKKDV